MNVNYKLTSWLCVLTAIFVLLTSQWAIGQPAPNSDEQLRTKFEIFLQQYDSQEKTKSNLNQLDLHSQKLLLEIRTCEQRNEAEVTRFTQVREIDALEGSEITSENNNKKLPEPDYPGTEEIDNRIKSATKSLINCRLMSSRLDSIRQEIFNSKRNLWIQGIKVRHKIWQFVQQPSLGIGDLQLSRIIPSQLAALVLINITLIYYFLLIYKYRIYYFKSYDKKPRLETLSRQFKSLFLTFSIPLVAAIAFAFWVNSPFQWLLLLMVTALLIRDGCLFLSLPMLPKSFNPRNINRFIWTSTALIVLAALGWNAIDYRQYNIDQWLASQSLFITPLFIAINLLFIVSSYYWYHVLKPYKDRFLAAIACFIALLTLLLYIATYAKLAQYLLVLNLGLLLLHLTAKIINGLRKILLVHRIHQLKAERDAEDENNKDDVVYSFPFWVSLLISLVVGVLGLAFIIWLGGGFQEAYQQLKLIFIDGFKLGSLQIVPSSLFVAIAISMVLVIALSRIRHGIEYQWFNKSRLKKGAREVVSMLFWYLGMTLVVFIGLSIAGFDISNLTVIAGALSVGIGFGLKNIVSDFVSGIILLFERPVKPGDWVEVGETIGFIQKIKMRATQIKTFDNSEVLVPNSELLSHHVTNWNLSNSIGRIIIKVGVAYGSDTEKVKAALLQVANNHNEVLNRSGYKPQIHFRSFGDSSLNFELRVMIYDIKNIYQVESDLNFAVDKAFRKAKITIPFPQRDLHFIDPLKLDGQPPNQDNDNHSNNQDTVNSESESDTKHQQEKTPEQTHGNDNNKS